MGLDGKDTTDLTFLSHSVKIIFMDNSRSLIESLNNLKIGKNIKKLFIDGNITFNTNYIRLRNIEDSNILQKINEDIDQFIGNFSKTKKLKIYGLDQMVIDRIPIIDN